MAEFRRITDLKQASSLEWDEDEGRHSFDDGLKRRPIDLSDCKPLKVKWSADREQKRAAIGYAVVLLIIVALLGIFLKAGNDGRVFTGSECVR